MMRNRFQKPDFGQLRKLFVDLAWIFGPLVLITVGFIYEVRKGNGPAACMFAGAVFYIAKVIEIQVQSLKK
jgi:hypothetical protein